jgi:hypothetical protein
MEYYLAVRMRRYGRSFQPADANARSEAAPDRMPGRTTTSASPVGAALRGTTVSTVRPVPRTVGREPGRY